MYPVSTRGAEANECSGEEIRNEDHGVGENPLAGSGGKGYLYFRN
jgi:hypothetical protein